eukprot:CAMPEP_0176445088 /NCGR_PEP_ID=MMETSP0127-20121128/23472_1 /TAXON_ID=938130 /ORGANISM="Platyophrya macrostoma, Strain WH" /LENGTH=58 /DNA_ID=CAMNT_0017830765 /DNA_START=114 /DNA_END=290 /DNA_ORIENTATION=-
MVEDISVSSEDFSDEFIVFELDHAAGGRVDFLSGVAWTFNALLVAIDMVSGLETNDVA